jgi:hypothetical protein
MFLGCNHSNKEVSKENSDSTNRLNSLDSNKKFFDRDLFFRDTLYINAQFMECGEWGGHIEQTKVYLKGSLLFLDYQKFEANCDSIGENNGKPPQTLKQKREKILSNNEELIIQTYMHQLLDAKFRESFLGILGNAGDIFEIKNSDSSIKIQVYSSDDKTMDQYFDFIKKLLG